MKSSPRLNDLLKIMEALRLPNGCPWDKKQSFESILDCLIEESYEYIDAVINHDKENMKEELGDILLQIIFHAQMANEKGWFDMNDIIENLSQKLIRRHPHVFKKNQQVNSVEAVEEIWKIEKQKEKQNKSSSHVSPLNSISSGLPSLLKSTKIQKKVAQIGFDWSNFQGSLDKIKEETQELAEEIKPNNFQRQEEELGDLLFSVVNLSRHLKINPDLALQKANQKFSSRFAEMHKNILKDKLNPKDLNLEQWDSYWKKVKQIKI